MEIESKINEIIDKHNNNNQNYIKIITILDRRTLKLMERINEIIDKLEILENRIESIEDKYAEKN